MHNKKGIRKSAWNRVKYSQDSSLVRSRPQAEAFPRGEILYSFHALLRLSPFSVCRIRLPHVAQLEAYHVASNLEAYRVVCVRLWFRSHIERSQEAERGGKGHG